MNRTIKTMFLAAVLFLVLGFSRAGAQTADSAAQKMTNKMRVEIGLTEEQIPEVLKVNQDFVKDASRINTEQVSRYQKLRAFKYIARKRNDALKKILTKEQYKEFEKIQEEKRQKIRERRR